LRKKTYWYSYGLVYKGVQLAPGPQHSRRRNIVSMVHQKKKKKRCHINDFCMLDKTKAGDKSRGSFLFFFPSYTLPTFSLFSLAIPQLMPPKKKCGPA